MNINYIALFVTMFFSIIIGAPIAKMLMLLSEALVYYMIDKLDERAAAKNLEVEEEEPTEEPRRPTGPRTRRLDTEAERIVRPMV